MLEAASAGCPLILGDIPTFRELWDGAAVFVAPDDARRARGGDARNAVLPGECRPAWSGGARPCGTLLARGDGGADLGRACGVRLAATGCLMRIVYFTHSLVSCWNHGNAHFLRGVLRALIARGHEVVAFEPSNGWSRANLVADHGEEVTVAFERAFPDLAGCVRFLGPDIDAMLDGADLVIVHEWNEPSLVRAIGAQHIAGGRFTLLFHDTHHRAVSEPEAIARFDLSGYDGVLAFGETLAAVYRRRGVRVFVWHEAADTRLFRPPATEGERAGVVWIGNWGDDERSSELRDYLLRPTGELGIPLDIYGVRYPEHAHGHIAGLWRALSRLDSECVGAGGVCPSPVHRACAASILRHAFAGHSDHSGF